MLIEDHRSKARRFDTAAAVLAGSGREILGIWALMHAATHRLNAALHEAGVTVARDEGATNAMGRYVSRTGAALPVEMSVGDLIHSDMPLVAYPSDADWTEAEAALSQLERLAAVCLRRPHRDNGRDGEPGDEWGLAEARAAGERFDRLLDRALARLRGVAPETGSPSCGNAVTVLLVRGATVVHPGEDSMPADVLVEDGRIAAVGIGLAAPAGATVIDAAGCHVLPGFIDPHVHMGIYRPFAEDMVTETDAAARGGVTTVLVFAKILSLRSDEGSYLPVLPELRAMSNDTARVNVGYHLALSTREHIDELARYRAAGIRSFKMYMGYRADPEARKRGSVGVNDGYIFDAMREIAMIDGALAMVHCENSEIATSLAEQAPTGQWTFNDWADTRPSFIEAEALQRSLLFAAQTRCPFYGVHISSAAGLQAAERMAPAATAPVYLEANLHHLLLTRDKAMQMPVPAMAKVSPPLRTDDDVEALWSALQTGALGTLGTDHACLDEDLKEGDGRTGKAGFPSLDNFTELFVSSALRRGMSLPQIAAIGSANPARIFGLHPRKGALTVGADADLVILRTGVEHRVDAKQNWSYSRFSPYDGHPTDVVVEATVVNGTVVYRRDEQSSARAGRWAHVAES